MYRSKISKTGRKIVIAAAAFAALAVPATANAATNLSVVDGPTMEGPGHNPNTGLDVYDTVATFEAGNGWNIDVKSCTSSNQRNASGGRWPQEFLSYPGYFANTKVMFVKGATSNQVTGIWEMDVPPAQNAWDYLASATVSCNVSKIGDVVKITHPLVWKSFSQHRSGTNTTSRSHSSSCYIDGYSGELHLDCWGGAYAQAKYSFGLPRDARYIHRSISSRAGCCDSSGSNSKYWVGNTAIARSTGWHSMYVRGVTVSYQHRVRTTKRTVIHNVPLHGTGIGQF